MTKTLIFFIFLILSFTNYLKQKYVELLNGEIIIYLNFINENFIFSVNERVRNFNKYEL